ncbi:MAG: (d)CMP kinase [Gemmatimonadota bacterium]
MSKSLVIAVDGPAGSGKSSAARGVAAALGLRYLDTGAMYRALTWWLLAEGIGTGSPEAVAEHAADPLIESGTDPAAPRITVNGQDVSGPIRTRAVSNAVSAVASVPAVRAHLVALQQDIIARACASGPGIVAEGRDIGTVVAPDATLKVFLTASEEVRASRRSADLAADPAATAELTQREQERRDRRDAPQMARAADAVEVDSTTLALDEVVRLIAALAAERQAGGRPADAAQDWKPPAGEWQQAGAGRAGQ